MRLPKQVKPGTQIHCNVRGRRFRATVVARTDEGLRIEPPRGHTYYNVTASQVEKIIKWDPTRTQITDESAI